MRPTAPGAPVREERLGLGGLAIWLAAALALPAPGRAEEEPNTNPATANATIFEQFKQFIADPPPIEHILFSYQGPRIARLDPTTNKVTFEPAPVHHIRAEWGPEHLFLLSASAPEILTPEPFSEQFALKEGTLLVRSGDEFWSFSSSNRVVYWKGVPTHPYDRGNSVVWAHSQLTLPLFAVMNMGPHFLPPQAIHWSGNRFTCQAKVIDGEFLIEGELFAGSDGLPEKMSFRIRSPTVDGRHLVRYEFGADGGLLPRHIPRHIRSVVLQGPDENPSKDIHILSLKLGTPASSPKEYPVAAWIRRGQFHEHTYTNHALYAVEPSGQLALVSHVLPTWKPPLVLAHASRYYYVSCALIFTGFLVLARRMREQTKQNKTTKGTPCKEMS